MNCQRVCKLQSLGFTGEGAALFAGLMGAHFLPFHAVSGLSEMYRSPSTLRDDTLRLPPGKVDSA